MKNCNIGFNELAFVYWAGVQFCNLFFGPLYIVQTLLHSPFLQALDGFLFVISYTGQIVYMSESITPLLGHLQTDLVGKDFLSLLHPEDILGVQEKMFPVSFEFIRNYIFVSARNANN